MVILLEVTQEPNQLPIEERYHRNRGKPVGRSARLLGDPARGLVDQGRKCSPPCFLFRDAIRALCPGIPSHRQSVR